MDKTSIIAMPDSVNHRNEEQAQHLRLRCLNEAVRLGGNGDVVLATARKFYDFVIGKVEAIGTLDD